MDNILFVNEYISTKDTMKQAYQYWYFRRPLAIFLYVFVVINAVVRFADIFIYGYVDPIGIFLVIFMGLIYPSVYFVQVDAAVKKNNQLMHDGDMKATVYVTSDRFYPSLDNEKVYIDISSVNYAFETKDYIMLVLKSTRVMLIFHKEGFTTGSLEEFVCYLRERKIKIKGRKK